MKNPVQFLSGFGAGLSPLVAIRGDTSKPASGRKNPGIQRRNLHSLRGRSLGEETAPRASAASSSLGWRRHPLIERITTMTMSYTFDFQPTPVEMAIIQQSGVLPKPTGVSAYVNIL